MFAPNSMSHTIRRIGFATWRRDDHKALRSRLEDVMTPEDRTQSVALTRRGRSTALLERLGGRPLELLERAAVVGSAPFSTGGSN